MSPKSAEASEEKLEIIGNTQTDTAIEVDPIRSATDYHQFDLGELLGGFVSHVFRNLVHIYINEGLQFEGRDANHPVSDIIGHALRLLECRAGFHRDILSHEMDQFGLVMQPLDHRHRPNKVLERCRLPEDQDTYGGNFRDRYRN